MGMLRYIADLDLPIKRGTSIELRTGLINVSPIGRNCSQAERMEYEKYDIANNVRKNFVAALEKEFPDYKMRFSGDKTLEGQNDYEIYHDSRTKGHAVKSPND